VTSPVNPIATAPPAPPVLRLALTPQETADAVGCSLRSIMAWEASGDLKSIRLGARCLRFAVDDIKEWLQRHRQGGE
jgi:excisionase family DNA binding protein